MVVNATHALGREHSQLGTTAYELNMLTEWATPCTAVNHRWWSGGRDEYFDHWINEDEITNFACDVLFAAKDGNLPAVEKFFKDFSKGRLMDRDENWADQFVQSSTCENQRIAEIRDRTLLWASYYGHPDIVDFLLVSGGRDSQYALTRGVANKAVVNAALGDGMRDSTNRRLIVNRILRSLNPSQIDEDFLAEALCNAVVTVNQPIVASLLHDHQGAIPLELRLALLRRAATKGDLPIIKSLLDLGWDNQIRSQTLKQEAKRCREAAVTSAAQAGHLAIVRDLSGQLEQNSGQQHPLWKIGPLPKERRLELLSLALIAPLSFPPPYHPAEPNAPRTLPLPNTPPPPYSSESKPSSQDPSGPQLPPPNTPPPRYSFESSHALPPPYQQPKRSFLDRWHL